MSTSNMSHLPPLDAHDRDAVGSELQATLVDLIDLALVGKQLHWSIVGPQFRALHLQLDELVDSWRALSDDVAERAVAIGEFPDGQADAIVAAEEHALWEREGAGHGSEADRRRAGELKVSLDRWWDLLRQRQAREEFRLDPDDATLREAGEVEGYQQ